VKHLEKVAATISCLPSAKSAECLSAFNAVKDVLQSQGVIRRDDDGDKV